MVTAVAERLSGTARAVVPDVCFRALYVKENATNGQSFSTTVLDRTGIESGGKWPFAAGNSARMDQLDRGVGQGTVTT